MRVAQNVLVQPDHDLRLTSIMLLKITYIALTEAGFMIPPVKSEPRI